jgi:hypothetical protein
LTIIRLMYYTSLMESFSVQERINMTADFIDSVGTVSEATITNLTAELLGRFLTARGLERWNVELVLQSPQGKFRVSTWSDFGTSLIFADLYSPKGLTAQISGKFEDGHTRTSVYGVNFTDRSKPNHRESIDLSSKDKQKEMVEFLRIIGDSTPASLD